MKTTGLLLCFLMAFLEVCQGQEVIGSYTKGAVANVDLPARVHAPDGIVSLWADFDHSSDHGAPLYLVNKTAAPALFEDQDHDLYIKLETKNAKGEWVRAQTHIYSGCGNSYGIRALQPGMHYQLPGYRPTAGRKTEVRFAMHSGQPLVSNVGEGMVSDAETEAARFDSMSLRFVPRQLRDAFDPERQRKDSSPEHLVNCLQLLHAYGSVPALRREAETKLKKWRSSPAPTKAEKWAVAIFEKVLASTWHEDVSADRLLRYCLETLNEKGGQDKPMPELLWQTISELGLSQFKHSWRFPMNPAGSKPSDDWKAATLLAVSKIVQATPQEATWMNGVLNHSVLTDRFVTSDALEPLLRGLPYSGANTAAKALARRGATERLAELAMDLPAENQPLVLAALASGGVTFEEIGFAGWGGLRRPQPNTKEEAFWQHLLATQPVQAAYALRHLAPFEPGPDQFGPIVLEGIRSYWRQEATRSQAAQDDFVLPEPGYSHRLSVDFLARSKRKEDADLFRALLTYRGYEPEEGFRSVETGGGMVPYRQRRFGVRSAALEALKGMGEPVPKDVVVQRDVTNPDRVVDRTNGQN